MYRWLTWISTLFTWHKCTVFLQPHSNTFSMQFDMMFNKIIYELTNNNTVYLHGKSSQHHTSHKLGLFWQTWPIQAKSSKSTPVQLCQYQWCQTRPITMTLVDKIVHNQAISHWPSYRSSDCCIGPRPMALGQYSRPWTCSWTNMKFTLVQSIPRPFQLQSSVNPYFRTNIWVNKIK